MHNKNKRLIFVLSLTKNIKIMKNQETLTVRANQSKRTFTIRKYIDGKLFAKYRTNEMTQQEFDSEEMNTENDWKQFLKSDDYYKVR